MTFMPDTALVKHLHNEHELAFTLLDDPTSWRERVVEKVVVEDADYVSVSSSYQIRLPSRLIRRWYPDVETGTLIRLLLPLTTRHKAVLLDVDLVVSPGHHCALLLKHQLARLQTNYMTWAARPRRDGLLDLPDADEMLYAISAYSPAIWDHFLAEDLNRAEVLGYAAGAFRSASGNRGLAQRRGRKQRLLADYLSSGLALQVNEDQVREWSELVGPTQQMLGESLKETADPRSASEDLLRCLPFCETRPQHIEAVTAWLERFVRFANDCDEATRTRIAGYGQRWDVIVDTVVPVDVPTKVQLRTARPWHDGAVPKRWPWSRTGMITQRVMVGDAQSGHAEIHLADHEVRVKSRPSVVDPEGSAIGVPSLSAFRWTPDKASIYVSGGNSPAFADIRLRLGLHGPTHLFLWLLIVATAASLPFLAVADSSGSIRQSAALLVLPLAGAILLARPATGAAQRLQHRLRVLLLVVVALAVLAAARGPTKQANGSDDQPARANPTPTSAPRQSGVTSGA
ncbi:hypothetical protein [Candidatus Poriferisodalis sp.]|uniref:hypothetical protein n=1 Tax=Candidatus Poriferisodalis sp. TaxID=3101277 RepID=UPI003B028245